MYTCYIPIDEDYYIGAELKYSMTLFRYGYRFRPVVCGSGSSENYGALESAMSLGNQ